MRHIRSYNESADEVLFREIDIDEWRRAMPRSGQGSTKITVSLDGETRTANGNTIDGGPTDPVPPVLAIQYLGLLSAAVGYGGVGEVDELDSIEVIGSMPDSEDPEQRYKFWSSPGSMPTPFLVSAIKSGMVEAHMIVVHGPEETDHVSTLFLPDDWVLVRYLGRDGDDWVYRCDGIRGARKCLEMIAEWERFI